MKAPDPDPNLTDVHVLVVDDHRDTLEVFAAALEYHGANVFKARITRDALTILKAVRMNAIVSDLGLPDEDGLRFIEQLRRWELETGRHTPTVAVTAHWEQYSHEDAKGAGFGAFLTKPVDPFDLAKAVAALIGR